MNRKYVLTADHCFVDKTQINNFQYWLLIFKYNAPCGATVAPPITSVIQGAVLKFYDSHADVLLLDIPNVIPDHYRVYNLGYDASKIAVPRNGYAIHHPAGNFARLSMFNSTAGSIKTSFTAVQFPPGEIQPSDTTHFEVRWGQGATEGGSSGSPLIDADTSRVVGVLTGGFSSCSQPNAPDYYGRLSAARPGGPKRCLSTNPPLALVAWAGGLEHYLSTDPPPALVADVADTLSQSMSGAVVVQALNGSDPINHGPGLEFYPTVINLSPGKENATFNYFLSDAPMPGETISMNMTTNGMVTGNAFDVTPNLAFSSTNDSFTLDTFNKFRRSINVSISVANASAFKPGDLIRWFMIFELTSDQDPNYKHIHTLKGIGQLTLGPWTQFTPIFCLPETKPCNHDEASIKAISVTQPNATGLAIFQRSAQADAHDCIDVCLIPGVLRTATVTIYINRVFTWTLSADPFGDPNCLHIPGLTLHKGSTYALVVSDKDDLDAVLPANVVHSLKATALSSQSDQIRMLEYQRIHLGPVAGPASPDSVTKSLSLALPPGTGDVNEGTRPAVAPGTAMLPTNPSLHAGVAAPAPAFPEDTGRAG